jgi:hypothetical protein
LVRGVGDKADPGADSGPVTPANNPESQLRIALGVVVASRLARDVTDADEMLGASENDSLI